MLIYAAAIAPWELYERRSVSSERERNFRTRENKVEARRKRKLNTSPTLLKKKKKKQLKYFSRTLASLYFHAVFTSICKKKNNKNKKRFI